MIFRNSKLSKNLCVWKIKFHFSKQKRMIFFRSMHNRFLLYVARLIDLRSLSRLNRVTLVNMQHNAFDFPCSVTNYRSYAKSINKTKSMHKNLVPMMQKTLKRLKAFPNHACIRLRHPFSEISYSTTICIYSLTL